MKSSIFHKSLVFVSILIVAGSLWSSELWPFLPFGVMQIARRSKFVGLLTCFLLFFLSWQGVGGSWIYSDVFVFGFLACGGLLLAKPKTPLKILLGRLAIYSMAIGLFLGIWWLAEAWQGALDRWMAFRLESEFLPGFIRQAAWEGDLEVYKVVLEPIFRASWLAWTVFSILAIFVFNALMSRLFEFELKQGKAQRRFWMEFSLWRAPEWVLLPWVSSILCLLVFYRHIIPHQMEWFPSVGWNLFVLCLFPLALGGLSFFSWLFPRIPFFFLVVLLLMMIFVDPSAILVVTGLADIWFDFRRRMRSNPFSGLFKDDDS